MRKKEMKYPAPGEPVEEFVNVFRNSEESIYASNAATQGAAACNYGLDTSYNPFHVCSLEGSNWLDGWLKEHNSKLEAV